MFDLLIIGSGPAGITAGIYAKRANLKVALLEKGAPGGQILNTAEVENYPGFKKVSGYDIASNMFEHLLELGVEVMFEEVLDVNKQNDETFEVLTKKQTLQSKSVLIATGAVPRMLNVEGEQNFVSNGISWCAICDGPLYKDKLVVVVGGGNSAVEEANFLASIATHVTVVQNLNTLTADKKAQDILVKNKNVDILLNAKVTEFIGTNQLEAVKVLQDDKELIIKTDGVFEYIGLVPVTNFLEKFGITNNLGYIEVNEKMETSIKGLYAAGDVTHKQIRQIVTAVNDGAIAAQNILKYLE